MVSTSPSPQIFPQGRMLDRMPATQRDFCNRSTFSILRVASFASSVEVGLKQLDCATSGQRLPMNVARHLSPVRFARRRNLTPSRGLKPCRSRKTTQEPRFQSTFNVQSWLIFSPIQVNSFPISLINADME